MYSPDTDVYNIGLGIANQSNKQYIVQLNVPNSDQNRYLYLNMLKLAFENDPDLASLPRGNLGTIMQSLSICTGCDFVSYIKMIGKATILKVFFQHAEYICGGNKPGFLNYTSSKDRTVGFLSFVHLIGTCYFKKHLAPLYSSTTR